MPLFIEKQSRQIQMVDKKPPTSNKRMFSGGSYLNQPMRQKKHLFEIHVLFFFFARQWSELQCLRREGKSHEEGKTGVSEEVSALEMRFLQFLCPYHLCVSD